MTRSETNPLLKSLRELRFRLGIALGGFDRPGSSRCGSYSALDDCLSSDRMGYQLLGDDLGVILDLIREAEVRCGFCKDTSWFPVERGWKCFGENPVWACEDCRKPGKDG